MNILLDIGHPAHVHLFRNFMSNMKSKGHSVFIATKKVNSIIELLEKYNLNYFVIGKKHDNIFLKYFDQLLHLLNLLAFCYRKKINVGLGVTMLLPIVAKFKKMVVIGFDDDDMSVTPVFAKFVNKSDVIFTPDALSGEARGENQISYAGYHEMFYLHPENFKPDNSVLSENGLKEGDKFFLLRFNSFKAHHDHGVRGLSNENKKELIQILEKHGTVFISTERQIDSEFEEYKISIDPTKIHSFLYYATMFIGDSQTMTSEAALLGTPALKCNTFAGKLSIPNEIENKYELCYSYLPDNYQGLLEKLNELLKLEDVKSEWRKRKEKLLSEKINTTKFLTWFVENYPKSKKSIKEDPNYQYKIK